MNLANESIDNIFSFLKPTKTLFINKQYYNKSISKIIHSINTIKIFHIYNKKRIIKSIESEIFSDILLRNYYILFYEYKLEFLERMVISNTYNDDINLKLFNNLIKIIPINKLISIGW
jgi:hypothetical protein